MLFTQTLNLDLNTGDHKIKGDNRYLKYSVSNAYTHKSLLSVN